MIEEDYKIEFIGGKCPVQADGIIKEGEVIKYFYFRARHNTWSLTVYSNRTVDADGFWKYPEEEEFYYEEDYGQEMFDAGYMPYEDVVFNIHRGIMNYKENQHKSNKTRNEKELKWSDKCENIALILAGIIAFFFGWAITSSFL